MQQFTDAKIEINIQPLPQKNSLKNEPNTTASTATASHHRTREREATEPADIGKSNTRYSVLKESKTSCNKRQANSSTKERSASRKKGISLCSKEIENNRMER